MRNKQIDLHNHLFEAIERLNDNSLSGEELDREIRRAKAVMGLANSIIDNGKLALAAAEYREEYGVSLSPVLGIEENNDLR